jgi:DNA repair protein RecO (recombination protein O)
MTHTQTYQTIVLQTYDVGEADRFCVLLTRERGRLAARARGVRRVSSRLGGSLLPHRRLRVTLHEGKTGFLVTGTQEAESGQPPSFDRFLQQQEMSELLLKLLHDEEPLPEIFDLAADFLANAAPDVTAFKVRLLQLMGLLPADGDPSLCAGIIREHSNGTLRVPALAQVMTETRI